MKCTRGLLSAITLLTLSLIPSVAPCAEPDPCAAIEQITSNPASASASHMWQRLSSWLYGSAASTPATQPLANSLAKPVYFTTAADYALVPSCTSDGPQLGRSLPYPLGLSVQKLGEKKWTYQGEQKNYFYVLAEYGLRFYLPPEHLAPLEAGKTYLFADAPEPVPYCVGRPHCTGEATNKHVLQGNLRYAVTSASIGNPRSCEPVRIEPYNAGGIPTKEKDAYIKPCIIDPGTGQPADFGGLRLITKDRIEKRFAVQIGGDFEGSTAGLVSKLVTFRVLDRKECGVAIAYETKLETAAKVELSFSSLASVSADADYVKKIVREMDPHDFYLFTTYSHRQLRPDDHRAEEAFHDLTFDARCDRNEPVEGLHITLYDEHFRGGALIITTEALRDIYIRSFGLKAYAPVLVNDVDQFKVNDVNDLKDGKFWHVRGVIQYLRWRTILRDYVQRADPVQDILNSWPPEEQRWVAEFFAHIILASSFDFGTPDYKAANP